MEARSRSGLNVIGRWPFRSSRYQSFTNLSDPPCFRPFYPNLHFLYLSLNLLRFCSIDSISVSALLQFVLSVCLSRCRSQPSQLPRH